MKYREPKIIKDKKEKKANKIVFWRIFFIESLLFLTTLIVAAVSAFKLNNLARLKEVYLPKSSWQDFLLFLLFVAIVAAIFFIYRRNKKFKEITYVSIFSLVIFSGSMIVLSLFLPTFGSILIIGVLIWFWFNLPSVSIHNILIILGISGLASFLGLSLPSSIIIGLLLVFSVFIFWSIYKNKYIVSLFNEMIGQKVIIGLIIPKKVKFFEEDFNKIKWPKGHTGNFIILGGLEVFLVGLLVVSAVPTGVINVLIIILFSLFGLLFSHWLVCNKEDGSAQFLVFPVMALFSILGYLITLFL